MRLRGNDSRRIPALYGRCSSREGLTVAEDTAYMETCELCGYTDGHDVDRCPRVLSGEVKKMPGLSPEALQRVKAAE